MNGASVDPRSGKYLTFRLSREEFAIQVLRVREIMGMQDITAVPQTPHYMKGVINLRGKIVPVIDLRLKFGFPAADYTERTCIIVVEVALSTGARMMGIIVDHVSEVLNVTTEEIEQTPQFGDEIQTDYMKGIAKVRGHVKILLDLDRVLGVDGTIAMPQPSAA